MKKKILMAALLTVGLSLPFSASAEEKPVKYEELPKSAQTFLAEHFSGWEIADANVDEQDYEVNFKNGSKIEFDLQGNWEEINCKADSVPCEILPSAISEYVNTNHKDKKVMEAKRENKRHELKLDNQTELEFDQNNLLVAAE